MYDAIFELSGRFTNDVINNSGSKIKTQEIMRDGRFLTFVVAALAAFALSAKVNVGIEAMPQLSNRPSWSAGVNLDIPVADRVYLSPGVYYSTRHRYCESLWQTYEFHPDGNVPTDYEKASAHIHADYLTVPLLVGFKASRPGYAFKVAGGLYYAYCLGGKSTLTQDYNGNVSEVRIPSRKTFIGRRPDFGLCFEVKYLLRGHYQVGLNLQQGLREVYQPLGVQGLKDPLMFHELRPGVRFHQSIGLSLGYVF